MDSPECKKKKYDQLHIFEGKKGFVEFRHYLLSSSEFSSKVEDFT